MAYFFHGYAGNQVAGDPRFYDISGAGNHAYFGANLSNANAWATAGYVATVNPGSGTEDSVIRIPGLNFDYAGGEKLIIWWLGKVTAEGAGVSFIGDGQATTYPGIRIRINADGTAQIAVSDTAAQDFSSSSAVIADGALRSMAFAVDGFNKKYAMWIDEAPHAAHDLTYSVLGSVARNTINSATFNIGSSLPKLAVSTEGMVSLTRACAIFRLGPTEALPSIAALTKVFQDLRLNPGQLVTKAPLR